MTHLLGSLSHHEVERWLRSRDFKSLPSVAIVLSVDCVAFGCFSGNCASQTFGLMQPYWGANRGALPFLKDRGPVCFKRASTSLRHKRWASASSTGIVEQPSTQGYHKPIPYASFSNHLSSLFAST